MGFQPKGRGCDRVVVRAFPRLPVVALLRLQLARYRGTETTRVQYGVRVRAEDLEEKFPIVPIDSDAIDAARMIAEHNLPGLLVTDASGNPYAVLPAFAILRFILPRYVQDDLALAGVVGDPTPEQAQQNLAGKSVGDLLPSSVRDMPSVDARATITKVAAEMAQQRSPLMAVTKNGKLHGVITASHLLAAALKS
jgi:CBS domain-containing protein